MIEFPIPPLFDHHTHYLLYAALSSMPSLADVHYRGQACDIIRGNSGGTVTVIQGWNTSSFPLTPEDLGESSPVIVLNLSLHGMVMNHAAEEFLSRDYNDVVLNYNNPLWAEKNISRLLNMVVCLARPSAEKIMSFGMSLIESGISAIEDMLLPDAEYLSLIPAAPVHIEFRADEHVFASLSPSERSMVNGVKLFTDGALGTFTAALTVPYLTGKTGILLMEDNVLADKFYNYMQLGIPLAVHAIGDRAVKQVAGTVSLLRRESGCSGPVRIEHAQFISRDDAFTAKDAGIGLSMQPNFSLDSVMYSDRLPRGYPALNNPFRMLIDEAGFIPGMDLLFGSDGMSHGMLPALRSALFPPFAGQVLTLQEFKDGYCIPGAGNEWLVHIDNGHVKISRL